MKYLSFLEKIEQEYKKNAIETREKKCKLSQN